MRYDSYVQKFVKSKSQWISLNGHFVIEKDKIYYIVDVGETYQGDYQFNLLTTESVKAFVDFCKGSIIDCEFDKFFETIE